MDHHDEAARADIELVQVAPRLMSGGGVVQALPPTDSGKQAYMVLAGCFLAEVFTWGMLSSRATTHPRF